MDHKQKEKENWEFYGAILAVIFGVLLLLSLVLQIPVFYHLAVDSVVQGELLPLTEEELDSLCLGVRCGYTHKILFGENTVFLPKPPMAYWSSVWVFYTEDSIGTKFLSFSHFLVSFFIFDILTLGWIGFLRFHFQKHKKLGKNSSANAKDTVTQKSEIPEEPLPTYYIPFILGYLEIGLATSFGFFLYRSFPTSDSNFFYSFIIGLVIAIFFYFAFQRRLGFILSGFLALGAATQARSLDYYLLLQNPTEETQLVYTLEPGEWDFSKRGISVDMSLGTSNKKKASFTHRFAVPFVPTENQAQSNLEHWLMVPEELMENPNYLQNFYKQWKAIRKVVLLQEESRVLEAIAFSEKRYGLNLQKGIYMYRPILSETTEISKAKTKAIGTYALFFGIWTLVGGIRIYAGRK